MLSKHRPCCVNLTFATLAPEPLFGTILAPFWRVNCPPGRPWGRPGPSRAPPEGAPKNHRFVVTFPGEGGGHIEDERSPAPVFLTFSGLDGDIL